ncbi:MAG: M48 family metallopeptidase [Candidatus Paceibacterota bacterium]
MNPFSYLRLPIFRTRSRKLYLAHKEAVRTLITERVKHLNQHYALPIGKIAIRNQKSRWGSCSKRGNLNFNYKLGFLSPELRDYVIVHEICHIREFNHGMGFWNLVGESTPNYRELRKQLRDVK